MKPNRSNRYRRYARGRGFALVISLSLMVLLTVLAVGLLTLSTLSLRSSGAGEARAEAEANARMALMLAIGELQVAMGPDQRISARASSIRPSTSEPNLLGTWDSWHWEPGTSAPNYGEKEGKFRRWLASTSDPREMEEVGAVDSAMEDPVWMVNPDTTGTPGTNNVGPGLRASRVPVELSDTRRGAYAWAVMDESLKAPVRLQDDEPASDAEKIARRVAPVRARPESVLDSLAPDKLGNPAKIVSLDSAVIAAELNTGKGAGKEILKYQADVTPYSVGLLTNVAEGGLKTDLTTVFESSSISSPSLNGEATLYNTVTDGAPRWDYLRNHYQLHRRVANSANGEPQFSLGSADLRPSTVGITASPATERLLPVVAKLQIMFSLVSHHCHINDRIQYYDEHGVPKGNNNYGVPHLVYDPVVTLYNPYDVTLNLAKLRVRVWDPPVLFGMKKNDAWLRPEFASGDYHGLARFQIANEKNNNARRFFTLFLRDMAGSVPGRPILLAPGEVRVFSPWVEPDWTWGKETAGQYAVRCFFDWNAGNDFGNVDGRTKSQHQWGVETVPGWNPRAGFQADHLSYSTRPANTRYDFERSGQHPMDGGWLAVKLDDTFSVEARPGRAVNVANRPDFRVDVLAALRPDYNPTDPSKMENSSDILRTYQFRFKNPTTELAEDPSSPTIRRTFEIGDILQTPTDNTTGGKSPFAILSMSAKTTTDQYDYSMPWLHNHPVVEGADQNSDVVGNALDSYDISLREVTDFATFPNGIELDPDSNRGFYGASSFSTKGVTNVPMFRVPLLPATSLGDLVTANLTPSARLPRVTHAFGNSRAHPLIPSNAVMRPALSGGGQMLDHSYLINDALWDSTYFSTVADFNNALLPGTGRSVLLEQFLEGDQKLLNPRFIPLPGSGSAKSQADELLALGDEELSRKIASVQGIEGPFNVNSDSVEAWKAFLSSTRDSELLGWSNSDLAPGGKTAFPRASLPILGDPESNNSQDQIGIAGQARWAGFRALDDAQITTLAEQIVEEIRARGAQDDAPSLTLGEFVNRRLGAAGGLHVNEGLLQKAILDSGVNNEMHSEDSKDLRTETPENPSALTGMINPQARQGYSAEGAPSILTQGDLLTALAPVITVRGDTFRIRAYGEARTPEGEVSAKAWCEAIVQRVPEYLDPEDGPEVKPADLEQESNLRFGRRFNITSFRWLSPEEV